VEVPLIKVKKRRLFYSPFEGIFYGLTYCFFRAIASVTILFMTAKRSAKSAAKNHQHLIPLPDISGSYRDFAYVDVAGLVQASAIDYNSRLGYSSSLDFGALGGSRSCGYSYLLE
jgi:hypothetical protein